MPLTKPILWLAATSMCAMFAVSCAPLPATTQAAKPKRILHRWYDDGGPGKVTVHISLPDQIAEFKRGGREIGWSYVATGKPGHATPAGSFRILEKIVDKHSNKYGWIEDEMGNTINGDATPSSPVPPGARYIPAPMPYWMRLTSYGIGMHVGIIPNPGQPASHGCIRMPKEFVPTLFEAVEVGTQVTISNTPATQGPHVAPPMPTPAARPLQAQQVTQDSPIY